MWSCPRTDAPPVTRRVRSDTASLANVSSGYRFLMAPFMAAALSLVRFIGDVTKAISSPSSCAREKNSA